MGKTTVLDHVTRSARQHGFTVLSTRGTTADAEIGFAGLLTLLRGLDAELTELAGDLEPAVRSALTLGSPDELDGISVRLGVYRVVIGLAERVPLMLAVDDGHLLDAATADVLGFVIGRLSADSVVSVITTAGALPGALAGRDAETVVLAPLTDEDLGAIVRMEGNIGDEAVDRCCALAGGNPLIALELSRSLDPEERWGRAALPPVLRPPAALARGLITQLDELPEPTRRALVVVAADDTGEIGIVRGALDQLGEPADALDAAEAAGIVQQNGPSIRLAHPIWRAAAYHQVAASSRRAAHRALATQLDRPQDAALRAWQLAAAADGPDEHAAAALVLVAGDLLRRGGAASAARVLERAASLSPAPATRTARAVAAARAWLSALRPAEARRVIEPVRLDVTTGGEPELIEVVRWLDGPAAARALEPTPRRQASDDDNGVAPLAGSVGADAVDRARRARGTVELTAAYDEVLLVVDALSTPAGLVGVPALLAAAAIEVQLSRRDDATRRLDDVDRLIRGCGWIAADATLFHLRGRLTESADKDSAPERGVAAELTGAEYRVAVAVATGGTNREAASTLFLSVKTVDFHLQNIYRKLGLRSRTELAVRMSRDITAMNSEELSP